MMADLVTLTILVDDKLKDKFENKAQLEQRTISGQLRFLMEAYVENRLEINE